jgi:hypothetical protein
MDNNSRSQNTENVIADYADEIKQIELEGNQLVVKKARNALFWTAGLLLLGEIFTSFRDGYELSTYVIAVIAAEVGIFIALALWTKKKPYSAIVAGIIIFIALHLLSAVVMGFAEGATGVFKILFSGIIVKIAILVILFRAVKDAKELQQAREGIN